MVAMAMNDGVKWLFAFWNFGSIDYEIDDMMLHSICADYI